MLLNFPAFSGEIPRLQADALPPLNAQYAKDCEFAQGDLRGVLGNSVAFYAPFAVKGFYVHGQTGNWYSWPGDVDAVRGPIVDDQFQRFYWSDGTAVYVSRGDIGGSGASPTASNKFKAGVPAPTTAAVQIASTQAYPDGVTGYAFKAFCSAGDTSTPTEVASSVATNEAGAEYTMTVTGTCGTPATAGTTLTYVGEAYDPNGNTTLRWQVFSAPNGVLYLQPDGSDVASSYQFTVEYNSGSVQTLTFWRAGTSDWYASAQGFSAPTGATSGEAGTLSFEITITLDSGDPVKLAVPLSSPVYLPADIGDGKWRVTLAKQSDTVFKFYVNTGGFKESRALVWTHVNIWGEESAPSPPLVFDAVPGIPAKFKITYAPATGYQSIDRIRFYRTATGSQETDYQYADEISSLPASGSIITWTDEIATEKLGEVLSTLGYAPPPVGLSGLVSLPNGILAAFKGNELWFSEPYLPYAWKPGNALALPNTIKGVCPSENSLFVTTAAYPHLISGVTPDAMSDAQLPEIQAGVSKNSITPTGPHVAYLTNDGIVVARGLDTTVGQSLQLFTREKWRERYGNHLASARLSSHDGAIICTFDNGAEGFILRIDEAGGAFSRYSPVVNATYVWPENDWLYMAQGSTVYAHKGSPTTMPFVWWSKDAMLPKPGNFGFCQVRGSGSVTLEFYADGVLKHTKSITLTDKAQAFRLPPGFKAAKWSVKATGQAGASLKRVTLANSAAELQSVG